MSEPTTDTRTEESPPPRPRRTVHQKQEMHVLPVLVKVLALGLAVGVAAALTPTLLGLEKWSLLVAVWAITGILVATYATGRGLPAKYLVPGVLLLVCFVVYPIILTAQLSTTNYGDGTRGTKEEAIAQIIGSSVKQTADAPRYNLSVATTGSVTEGPFVFLLVDQETEEPRRARTTEHLQAAARVGMGIGALAASFTSVARQGGALKLLNPTGHVKIALGWTKLDKLLDTHADEQAALASFSAS